MHRKFSILVVFQIIFIPVSFKYLSRSCNRTRVQQIPSAAQTTRRQWKMPMCLTFPKSSGCWICEPNSTSNFQFEHSIHNLFTSTFTFSFTEIDQFSIGLSFSYMDVSVCH